MNFQIRDLKSKEILIIIANDLIILSIFGRLNQNLLKLIHSQTRNA
jgi:hypothetical protein